MERLVDDLLATSRDHANTARQSVAEPTDAGRFTRELTRLFAATAAAADLTLDVAIDDGLPPFVELDREGWTRIVLNLLSNAFKYTASGGVRVELRWDDDRMRLRVNDSGVGVAEDERDLLFERFYQARARPVRGERSTGLGLAMVADLAQAAGGTCSIDSEVGRGTTFTVVIPAPVCDQAQAHDGQPGSASDPDPVGEAMATARVLVVEDETDTREFTARVLTRAGYSVVAVADTEAARRAISGVDIVLADVGLLDDSGIDLLTWLRAQPAPVGILPVILVSASVDRDQVAHSLTSGADDYVATPFGADELCARVAIHVELHRHRLAALATRSLPDKLSAALTVDEAVGSAIGAMMADRSLTPDEALAELRAASQASGRPLAEVALDTVGPP
jgi:DNA-binding response OmpR family regulator/two-component sensor histidine kinase